ncbi:hypothetical protein HRR83_003832 [Exophiala dermatitidis]|uniref:Synaptobrevin n=1 Tax=Exophiala dermatitidis TaxID=5970 RepID=A0AAN6EXW7_EXODE|nr:hypothetical protein HRR75_002551 [Exophiala dermatitidis]KAJ4522203.1 hypothetical protein HRR74_002785 [Exophiala dermatitidis]KAJ4529529.1 hypothetical protein HRR73_000554 [Exophiala dermatitidis]KAJ4543311.1 hypothetical protein HRR77_005564 [Exophiala dermatitidis]KAJ4543810.1 hypothetical protein HRR76_001872 [Exophiala dermatitidis]
MSLTSALRPVGLPFRPAGGYSLKREQTTAGHLNDNSNVKQQQQQQQQQHQPRSFQHEVDYLNLHRTLIRLQHLILLTPSLSSSASSSSENASSLTALQRQIQAELWSPLPYYRNKWLHSIEGARTVLLQLERKAQNLRVQRAKYDAAKDLAEKRAIIKKLRNRVEEIGREVEREMGNKDGNKDLQGPLKLGIGDEIGLVHEETLYDVLKRQQSPLDNGDIETMETAQKEPVQDETEDHNRTLRRKDGDTLRDGRPVSQVEEERDGYKVESKARDTRGELFASTSEMRHRGGKGQQETKSESASTSGFSNLQSTERSLLDSSRVQEDITTSLVKMAAQLKQQSRAMQFSLEQDKGILGRALQGLDLSVSGMEAASKNMAFLRRMSEEEGWFGRLKLYAMIFAMWIVAILLVFVCPKLRF